ncbi:hypothetical protein ACOXXX_09515 [Thalassococcus sp. BH17M4-6]|uniref:hypothetical protein n=1 Tax=Thalassococcus sp. BH17M4-6 TaxID=3413148 RepID=UPI003BE31555
MWGLPQTSDTLIALGTLIAGSAALWGAYTASKGLDRWKNQKEWEDNRQLARDMALIARECSDYFHSFRSPFMSAGEMDMAFEDKFEKAVDRFSEREKNEASALAMSRRLQRLNDPMQRLYPRLIEADLLWGSQLERDHSEMRRMINRVVTAHELQDMGSNREENNEYRRTAYGMRDDEIGQDFELIVKRIIAEAKRKIGQSR